jgi:hypothetical protein
VQDLYNEHHKTLKTETEENVKTSCVHWIGRINIVKTAILPKVMYRLNNFFTEIIKKIPKFIGNTNNYK